MCWSKRLQYAQSVSVLVKVTKWIRNHLPTQRRLIQLYTALLYNAHLKGFISGNIYTGNLKILCAPGLNCYSCPGASVACPLGALQNAVASSGSRLPAYLLGIILLYGLILGRTICGYLCPFGLIQELLNKIPTPKVNKNRFTRGCSYIKYVILAVFVILLPLFFIGQGPSLPAFCKYICPAGTLEGAVGLLSHPTHANKFPMLGLLFTHKFVLMILICAVCVFTYRAFCRFLCPLGAIYGLFSRLAVIGVKVESAKCVDCGKCISRCPMDIHRVGDHECIHCGKCVDVCPTNAISFKAGKYTIHSAASTPVGKRNRATTRRYRMLAWLIALSVLIGVLVMVNWGDDPAQPDVQQNTSAMIEPEIFTGKDPGMLAPDFSVPLYGGNQTFHLSDYRGKTVILNFWATWCSPCVKELPYFDEIKRKYGDAVEIVAIHSNLVTEDVEAYLSKYDYCMLFTLDTDNTVIPLYGGSTMLPQTIIVDTEGVVFYNAVGSLTLDKLEKILTETMY